MLESWLVCPGMKAASDWICAAERQVEGMERLGWGRRAQQAGIVRMFVASDSVQLARQTKLFSEWWRCWSDSSQGMKVCVGSGRSWGFAGLLSSAKTGWLTDKIQNRHFLAGEKEEMVFNCKNWTLSNDPAGTPTLTPFHPCICWPSCSAHRTSWLLRILMVNLCICIACFASPSCQFPAESFFGPLDQHFDWLCLICSKKTAGSCSQKTEKRMEKNIRWALMPTCCGGVS